MNKPARTIEWLVWGALGLTIAGIAIAFIISEAGRRGSPPLPVITQQLPDFVLTNQHGQAVTRSNLLGQIFVADIIFTRCAGPCPKMTSRMEELQSALPARSPVQLVTLTTDPENDTPAVLRRYAERFHARAGRWQFLTGAKAELARLAIDGLKLTALDKDPAQRENDTDFFIHSTIFILVDKHGRVRGAFESLEPEMKNQILAAIHQLQREK